MHRKIFSLIAADTNKVEREMGSTGFLLLYFAGGIFGYASYIVAPLRRTFTTLTAMSSVVTSLLLALLRYIVSRPIERRLTFYRSEPLEPFSDALARFGSTYSRTGNSNTDLESRLANFTAGPTPLSRLFQLVVLIVELIIGVGLGYIPGVDNFGTNSRF